MTPFEIEEPRALSEAVAFLDPGDPTIRPLSGGTALVLLMKAGVFAPSKIVSLRRIESKYSEISATDSALAIGALTTLGDIERSRAVCERVPLISRTLKKLANARVRNVATVGGALAHGDPHMDLPPVLMALGAAATVVGPAGERMLPVEELFVGYYETSLANNEIIAAVTVPWQREKRASYLKVTTGSADDWPALGVAVVLEMSDSTISDPRLVVSAATDKATRLTEAESVLAGQTASAALWEQAAEAAIGQAELLDDSRGTVPYKRHLLRISVRRALQQACDEPRTLQ